MTIVAVETDYDELTVVLVAEFTAPVDEVWQLWADPRLLERWWGPPQYPAAFDDFDLTPGARVAYSMTGPDGDTPRGWWQVISVDSPRSLVFRDGFADADGEPVADPPANTVEVTLAPIQGGTRMTIRSGFDSVEHLERLLGMGAAEGLEAAVAQMDGVLEGEAR
jgi:uncharacterized protein YndB with AHSA1/START domain